MILLKCHRFQTVGDKSGLFVKIHFFLCYQLLLMLPYL